MKKVSGMLKIDIDNKKVKKITLYALAFFIPFFVLLGIIITLKVYPFGENTYMPVDAFNQYTPYLQYFKEAILGTNSMFYSLGKSIGGEMYGLFTYYLMSPFNLIALLFRKEEMGIAFFIIMLIKISASGGTFYYFLNRKKEPKVSNLIFSSMYALSAAAITYGLNIMWLDSLILLPILCVGIENLISGKRPILYTIVLALILITNYYMGFICCIFAGIYFLYKLILSNLKPSKNTLKIIGKFAIFSIIAVMISAIILLPSFIGIRDGRAEFDFNQRANTNFEIQDIVTKFFTNTFGLEEIGNWAMPQVFSGMLANFLVLTYFINSKIKLKEKIATLALLIIFFASFYIDKLNLLWVMGNEPACFKYRYIFCFTLIFILTAQRAFENIKEGIKTWKLLVVVAIIEALGILTLYLNLNITDNLFVKIDMILVAILYIIISLYIICLYKEKKKISNIIITCLLLINIVNLGINAKHSMEILQYETSKNKMEDQIFLTSFREYKYQEIKKHDSGMYRQEATNKVTTNAGITFDYNGISFSASTFSKELHTFLRNMGFGEEHVTVSMNEGNTKAMDMLFGIKYILGENNKEYIEEKFGEVEINRNDRALSLGFSVSDVAIKDIDIIEENVFENQNNLLKRLANQEENILEKHQGEIKRILENVEISEENYKRIDTNKAAFVKYEFEIEQEKYAYLHIPYATKLENAHIYVNGKKASDRYISNTNRMLLLGKHSIGEKITIVIEQKEDRFFMDREIVYYENEEVLDKYYQILSKEQANLREISGREYEADIDIQSENRYILFTIPYDKGWEVKVDGKKQEPIKMQNIFMAVEIDEKGEHKIEMKYTPKGLISGAILSFTRNCNFCMFYIDF